MKMIKSGLLGLMLLLSACVHQNVYLKNTDGNAINCNSMGFGIIGTPVAAALQHNCEKEARAAGYNAVYTPVYSSRITYDANDVTSCKELGNVESHPPYVWPGDADKQLKASADLLGGDTVLKEKHHSIVSYKGTAYKCH